MRNKNYRVEFMTLFAFLLAAALLLSNGFVARINAQAEEDVYRQLEPLGVVLDEVQKQYVREVAIDELVEGALYGIMSSLDAHSSYLSADDLELMKEDTTGEFMGIGVSIKLDDRERVTVFQPIPNSPAAEAGLKPFDIIAEIDGVSTADMTLQDAAERIRGPRGTKVQLTILRPQESEDEEPEMLEFEVRRDRVPLASIKEERLLDDGIGYVRLSDFKQSTADELEDTLRGFLDEGMRALVLDMRWNPGGLLTASQEVSDLFLPRRTLVTYTKGREQNSRKNPDDLELYTDRKPMLPEDFPVILLVNEQTASSSEIVTGALQFYKRAIIVGEKTFGKGSVQTIIPLERPENTALRLTTALYYTPGDVTIDKNGILPDVTVEMEWEQERALGRQMYESYADDPDMMNQQNHGSVTGNEVTEDTVEDIQLGKAVDILNESDVWEELIDKYHRATTETQMTAAEAKIRAQKLRGQEGAREEGGGAEVMIPDPDQIDKPLEMPSDDTPEAAPAGVE